MIAVGAFGLLRPWWLLAIPIVFALAWFYARRWAALGSWEGVIDSGLRSVLTRLGHISHGRSDRHWSAAWLGSCIALALAGPAVHAPDTGGFRNLDGLVLAIDLSKSVTSGGNLQQALIASRLVLQGAGTRPVALIVYGEDAYVASDFTIDPRSVGNTIAVLDAETVPGAGSNAGRALDLAARLFSETGVLSGDVVMVSDGGGLAATEDPLSKLIASGSRVSGVFVPSAQAAPADMPTPQRGPLQELAARGGGIVADAIDPSPVISLASMPLSERLAEAGYGVLAWQDLGRWLLILAAIPALSLFRRRV
jgi:Ca-activated chloride channel family protein